MDPLIPFVVAGLASPGPNIILLMASGVRFGFRRTLPHVLGVALGVGVIAATAGFGVAALLAAMPRLALSLKLIAFAWIFWLAWGLLRAARRPAADPRARPFRFHEAVLFQWINPKVWAVALAAGAGFASDLTPSGEAVRMASTFAAINLVVCLTYTLLGAALQQALTPPARWRAFLTVMAVLLAASGLLVFA